jgi:hypothetical protein
MDNKANPFPSSWENIGNMIKKLVPKKNASEAEVNAVFDTVFHITASCIGAPVASKFISYCKMINKLDMDAIIKDPKTELKKLENSNDRASLLYAVIFSIGQRWVNKDKKVTASKVLDIADALPPEFATSFVMHVLQTRMSELTNQGNKFEVLLTRFGKFFDV